MGSEGFGCVRLRPTFLPAKPLAGSKNRARNRVKVSRFSGLPAHAATSTK